MADIVVLKNGRRLEGRVVAGEKEITVYTRFGSIKVDRDQVDSILPSKTVLDELQEKQAAIQERIAAEKPDGVAQGQLWFGLAQWCGEKQLDRAREENLRRAIAADPDQPLARQALGYLKVEGRWVTGAERQQALGFVRYGERWVTPEARDDAEKAGAEAHKRDLEQERQEAEVRVKKAEAEKLEAEKRLIESQTDRARDERARLDREWDDLQRARAQLYDSRYYWPYYFPVYGTGPYPQPPATTPAAPVKPRTPPASDFPNSGLNNGVSGPGMPVLK
ncbi:MAG: hypothetical protein HY291_14520 [Planctomycetes bacterium]|nr:hypothetical protein [Planctomycetota bacterium]